MRMLALASVAALSLIALPAFADTSLERPALVLTIKDHTFDPQQLTVPADKPIKLTVRNMDPTPAEFESEDFQAEKVVPANGETVIYIAPLKAGTYGFYDDFHEDDTKGTIVAQ